MGPHVIGQRVVVRRIVPGETGPSGGPALTDTLGVCEHWGEGTCLLRLPDGATVLIPTRLIVSGKPVPPRPSIRDRVPAREAELHGLALWPSLVTEPLGEWVLRRETDPVGRRRKRANSALAYGDPGISPDEVVVRVREFYGQSPALAQFPLEEAETWSNRGWGPSLGDVHFHVAATAQVLRRIGSTPAVELAEAGDRATATLGPLASGVVALDGDWAGVHSITVDPRHRRQGHATALLATLVDWAASRGATTVWLHVEADNTPALGMYDGLGFRTHHTSRYLMAPPIEGLQITRSEAM